MPSSQQSSPAPLGDLTERLRQNSRKVTAPRQAMLEILRRRQHPLTIKELHGALPPGDCDLATVYRSVRLLEELGMVRRFDFGEGAARFELVETDPQVHHHHLVCTRCTEIVKLEDCCLPDLNDARVGAAHGFKNVKHRLEFFGLCPACQG